MNNIIWALLAFVVLLALAVVAGRVRLVLTLYRVRMEPPAGEPLFDDAESPRALTDCEAAGLAELEGLGFVRAAQWRDCRAEEAVHTLFLAHADRRVFALLPLSGSSLTGYMVTFQSFEQDGKPIATVNRVGWIVVAQDDTSNAVDARADSLADQLAFHRARAGAACELDPDEAMRRMRALIVADGIASLANGKWVRGRRGAHMSMLSATRAARALQRDRVLLGRPFASAVTSGELVPSFMSHLIGLHDRAAVRKKEGIGALKSMLLLGSLLAGLWAWGIAFDWRTAAMLVAVLLVHESGHAVAMRLFGWGDMHMFFIPMVGAVVTGQRPREVAAWKDAVVLLAGPVPGLLAGLALLAWPPSMPLSPALHSLAIMAVIVNAFNLLPLMPLDGGRLVELALFSRWPRGRVVLLAASAAGLLAFGIWLKAPLSVALAVLLTISWRHQWRLATLEREVIVRDPGTREALELRVSRVVHERNATAGLPTKVMLALAVLARRRIRPPRVGESLLIVVVLVALWSLAAAPLIHSLFSGGRFSNPVRSSRTMVQQQFDEVWYDAAEYPSAQEWAELATREAALKSGDPRHRDVDWLKTQVGDAADRMAAVDRWLKGRGNGHFISRDRVIRREVNARIGDAAQLPAAARIGLLTATMGWLDALHPHPLSPAIAIRLRLAETEDLVGDAASVNLMLDQGTALAAQASEDRGEVAMVVRARAWLAIAHGHPELALRQLEAASPPLARGAPDDALAVDHAWARLLLGQSEVALAEMRAALHAPGTPRKEDVEFDADDAMDLAVAQARAGQPDQARELAQGIGRLGCGSDARREVGDTVEEGPWQVSRVQERVKLAKTWCARSQTATCPASAPASGGH